MTAPLPEGRGFSEQNQMNKIEELHAAYEAATPGADVCHATVGKLKGIFCGTELLFGGSFCDYYEPSDEEYRFIALAHNNMPALLEAVEALAAYNNASDLQFATDSTLHDNAKAILEKLK